jgi:hypothetical protein
MHFAHCNRGRLPRRYEFGGNATQAGELDVHYAEFVRAGGHLLLSKTTNLNQGQDWTQALRALRTCVAARSLLYMRRKHLISVGTAPGGGFGGVLIRCAEEITDHA